MKRYRRTKISQYIVVSLLLAGVIGFGFGSWFLMTKVPFTDQFVLPWSAGRAWLLEAANPYGAEITGLAEDTLQNSEYLANLPEEQALLTPFINLIFYLPFSLIPYELSRVLWMLFLGLSIVLLVLLSFQLSEWKIHFLKKTGLILFSLIWIPGFSAIITGQLSPIIILLLFLGVYLVLRGQDTAAGFILAATSGSFIFTGLCLILILSFGIIRKRWSIITAYLSGLGFLIIISLLLLPSWPRDWIALLIENYTNADFIETPLMVLAAFLPGIEQFLSIFLHGLFAFFYVSLIFTLREKNERILIWNSLAALVISHLVNVQGSIYYLFLLFPAMFLVFRFLNERWGMVGQAFSWVFILLIGLVPWLGRRSELLYFDLLSQPFLLMGLPFIVILGMIWIRWWALRIPKLPFDS